MSDIIFWNANRRRMVCKSCKIIIDDCEPHSPNGDFFHKSEFGDGTKNSCPHADKYHRADSEALEPFMRKRTRRAHKRATK